MIRDEEGVKTSAKGLAQDILLFELENACRRWLTTHSDVVEAMTDREFDLVNEHLFKQFSRVCKVLGAEAVKDDDKETT